MKLAQLLLGITVATTSLGLSLSPAKASDYHQEHHASNYSQQYAYRTVCKYKKVFVAAKHIPAHYEHGHYVKAYYIPAHYESRKVCVRVRH
ncbi:hypothetical protein [Merismopedia glauca]|uniref:Uncharacterized protein n=1 Tax=Merismopedia glauca CCAP 1448/3 TaxID=1296344 RepID=A0A2T1C3Z9_9CYAN|nr:hypothetical protein [Merismopedia glauca]PSB03000.1 hypothetical protein C7B64_10410 [Merismopedia glauca CCAP 1448/3]